MQCWVSTLGPHSLFDRFLQVLAKNESHKFCEQIISGLQIICSLIHSDSGLFKRNFLLWFIPLPNTHTELETDVLQGTDVVLDVCSPRMWMCPVLQV